MVVKLQVDLFLGKPRLVKDSNSITKPLYWRIIYQLDLLKSIMLLLHGFNLASQSSKVLIFVEILKGL